MDNAGVGARYVAHRDNTPVDHTAPEGARQYTNQRQVTCIIYINPTDWQVTLPSHVAS